MQTDEHTVQTLYAHWLAESLRLREEHEGPLDDAQEVRLACAQANDLPARILLRAGLLAKRTGLTVAARRWTQTARLVLSVAAVLALLTGASAALTALGDGLRPVNVLWAASGLLGLHALTLLLWLGSLGVRSTQGAGLGRLCLAVTRRLAHGAVDFAACAQAWVNLLARHGALRWVLGGVSHGLWLLALVASLATLLFTLSTRHYGFVWETTILSPETFVMVTQTLGGLPTLIGFPVPDAETIRASDSLHGQSAAAQALWSGWLIGLVTVYGILPRLLGLLVCALMTWAACHRLRRNPHLADYAVLRARLTTSQSASLAVHGEVKRGSHSTEPKAPLTCGGEAPTARSEFFTPLVQPGEPNVPDTSDAPPPARATPRLRAAPTVVSTDAVLVAIDLPPDLPWPPADLPAGIRAAPSLNDRMQRHTCLAALRRRAPARLLIACDARQTPDRGTLALIVDLAALAGVSRVWLLAADRSSRTPLWTQRLRDTGLPEDAIGTHGKPLLHWLAYDERNEHV